MCHLWGGFTIWAYYHSPVLSLTSFKNQHQHYRHAFCHQICTEMIFITSRNTASKASAVYTAGCSLSKPWHLQLLFRMSSFGIKGRIKRAAAALETASFSHLCTYSEAAHLHISPISFWSILYHKLNSSGSFSPTKWKRVPCLFLMTWCWITSGSVLHL